jgi:cytochrome P450 / NADPH-cytochrome P450 reductase
MTETISLDSIPGPRGLPLVGNIRDIDSHNPTEGMVKMAREYGPIFKLAFPGSIRLFVSGLELVDEICDDERFDKKVGGGLAAFRGGPVTTGLFTADTENPLWSRAHNILMAPFSMQSMRDYIPAMLDIAHQLMDKWERLNPDEDVDVPADMTRLTLDTIALCGFGYRFNSFYRDTPHPFVAAMVRALLYSQQEARQLPVQSRLKVRARRQAEEDTKFMNDLVGKLVEERREQGDAADNTDLLGRMLTGVDKQTGERLPDENIKAQCITFLIAGHETTSGLLSFATYYLMKNPDIVSRARAEVDEVLGATTEPTYEQVHRLKYVTQILNEALRVRPTVPGFNRAPYQDTVIGNRYQIPAGTPVTVLTQVLHRDQGVWGPDAEEFNPDHTAVEKLATLPPNAFKPFGTGQRACIGRQFALQEATLVLGMLLQRFELVDYLGYQLRIKSTLTVKPDEMRIQVRRREKRPIDHPVAPTARPAAVSKPAPRPVAVNRHGTPLLVMYGSNLGTAEGIATRLAQEGNERGFDVTLDALDEHTAAIPSGGATIVVSASYNGQPPDNAARFCGWLQDASTSKDACAGVSYTVFGCGNTDWAATYQAVPILVDAELEAHGAKRIHARGEGDVREDFDAQYRSWHNNLWSDIAQALDLPAAVADPASTEPKLAISLINRQVTNPVIMSYHAQPAMVRLNRELQGSDGKPAERSTRHVEIALPAELTYHAGDHLGVLPRNHVDLIRRVMLRFSLDAGMYVTIVPNRGNHTHLPIEEPAPLLGVLGSCVELQDVATRADIEMMARYTEDPAQRAALEALTGDDDESHSRYQEQVFLPYRSILDLLETYPACALPFEVFLDLLPPLRPRYYSISSSPLVDAEACSITAGVVRAPARSGQGVFNGVCSNHIEHSPANSTLFVFVREPTIAFRPPENPHVPMIMVGAGTGIAPFRGFLQERAALRTRGVPIAESLLFFGCRNSEQDFLYADELREWEKANVVRVENAFSRAPREGPRYVQDAIRARSDEVLGLIDQGAAIFVCGNANTIAPGVRAALTDIFREKNGASEADADAWLAGLKSQDRFLEDVWGVSFERH